MRLTVQAFGGLGFLLVAMAAGLFLPVLTLDYWQAWVFLAVFGGSVIAVTVYLVRNDPALLERRVHAGPVAEKLRRQQLIQSIANLAFIAVIVVPPIDRRLGWSAVPMPVALAGDLLVALGVWVVFRVFRRVAQLPGADRLIRIKAREDSDPFIFDGVAARTSIRRASEDISSREVVTAADRIELTSARGSPRDRTSHSRPATPRFYVTRSSTSVLPRPHMIPSPLVSVSCRHRPATTMTTSVCRHRHTCALLSGRTLGTTTGVASAY